jgi:hypothetical protein
MENKELLDAVEKYVKELNYTYYKLGKCEVIEKATIGTGDNAFTIASVNIGYIFIDEGETTEEVPIPAMVFIDKNRTIVNIDVDFNSNERVSLKDMVYSIIENSRA